MDSNTNQADKTATNANVPSPTFFTYMQAQHEEFVKDSDKFIQPEFLDKLKAHEASLPTSTYGEFGKAEEQEHGDQCWCVCYTDKIEIKYESIPLSFHQVTTVERKVLETDLAALFGLNPTMKSGDKRVPRNLFEDTLFTGSGPAYLITAVIDAPWCLKWTQEDNLVQNWLYLAVRNRIPLRLRLKTLEQQRLQFLTVLNDELNSGKGHKPFSEMARGSRKIQRQKLVHTLKALNFWGAPLYGDYKKVAESQYALCIFQEMDALPWSVVEMTLMGFDDKLATLFDESYKHRNVLIKRAKTSDDNATKEE